MSQDKVSKLSDSGKNVKPAYEPGYSERWNAIRPTKTIVFAIAVGVIILTLIVGFNWGGWVTGGTATAMAQDAVVQRLAGVCVGQYNQDLGKIQKLRELKGISLYQQDDYVKEQGWATMPGEEEPERKVVDACTKLLGQLDQ